MRDVPAELATKLVASAARLPDMADVRMDDIAKASGIPRATLYYYFAGKDDILGFLLDSYLADLGRRIAEVTSSDDDVPTRLRAMLEHVLQLPVTTPELSHLLLLNMSRTGKLGDQSEAWDAAVLAPLRQLLEEGVANGDLVDLDVPIAATAIFGAASITGLASALVNKGHDVLADDIFRLVWNGVVKR